MSRTFCCKGRQLADYLVRHGSKLIETGRDMGVATFIFEYDDSIDKNLRQWEENKKKWLF